MKKEKEIKVFYTDGACSGNPGKGGFGIVQMGEISFNKRNALGNWENVTLPSIEYSLVIIPLKF